MIVFDFDGVLFDSFIESFISAVNTYIELYTDHDLPLTGPLHRDSLLRIQKEHSSFTDAFSSLMPFGNFAQDYLVILTILEKRAHSLIQDQDAFDRFKATLPEKALVSYQDAFYHLRRTEQQSDPEGWTELLSPFPGIPDALHTLSQRSELAVATSKDRASVHLLLERYGLNAYFTPDAILDKDFGPTKRSHLSYLQKRRSIRFDNIHFIDDKVHHLLSVRSLGLHVYLALWGYNTAHQHEIARQEGIPLLERAELIGLGGSPDDTRQP